MRFSNRNRSLRASVLFVFPLVINAQQVSKIPIRTLGPAIATDSGLIRYATAIRVLSDGSVLLNDRMKKRIVLFDSALKFVKVVADTTDATPIKITSDQSGIVPYIGDTTLFADYSSRTFVVIDPKGNYKGVMSPPKPTDFVYIANVLYGVANVDDRGRMTYRGVAPQKTFMPGAAPADTIVMGSSRAPIIRADFDTRHLDTIATIEVSGARTLMIRGEGRMKMISITNPLPAIDAWAVLSDGTVAIVRGHDYHVDWYHGDGSHESTPKMPFDWRPLNDDAKKATLDSAQRLVEKMDSLMAAMAKSRGTSPQLASFVSVNALVKQSELPDYVPPLRQYVPLRVDNDGNLWILPSTSSSARGGSLYDVVNRRGEIIERVQLPEGRTLEGFGKNDWVYMSVPGVKLERARIIR